jgi:hypothetical protein
MKLPPVVNFINVKGTNIWYERHYGRFFSTYVCMYVKKAAKTTFVRNICTFNVDEIDTFPAKKFLKIHLHCLLYKRWTWNLDLKHISGYQWWQWVAGLAKQDFYTPRINFINILRAAFAPVDLKSVKRYWQHDWIVTLLGAMGVKAVRKYVGEIEPWDQFCSSRKYG